MRHPDRLALVDGRDGEVTERRLSVGVALGGFAVVRPHVRRHGQALGDALERGGKRRRLLVFIERGEKK